MVGIFDSGVGGEAALAELRLLRPHSDVCFFADRKNAPYGTKSQAELVDLVSSALEKLAARGAAPVLLACCTASTVYDLLPERLRRGAIPIIDRAAEAAVMASLRKRIGVISTEATYRSGAFVDSIGRLCKGAYVAATFSGELVSLAEAGYSDENMSPDCMCRIREALMPLSEENIDTVILGCTHFARFEKTIEKILRIRSVNSARIGAVALSAMIPCGEGSRLTDYI